MGDRRYRYRRVLAAAMALVLLGVGSWVVGTDLQAQSRLRHERQSLATAQTHLVTARHDLVDEVYARGLASAHLAEVRTALTTTLAEVATTEGAVVTTDKMAYIDGLAIGTLRTCLGGVQAALQQITAHDNSGATADISAVSAACLSLDAGSSGLVYPFDFPDPDVLLVDGTYFAYATNSAEGNIQIIDSTDLQHWTSVGNALPQLPGWAKPNGTWAPAVLPIGGKYLLYYAAVVGGAGGGGEECISVATATQPQGPFVDSSTAPLVCQSNLDGSIDPDAFVDSGGTPYLIWKSNGQLIGQAAAIWSEKLNPAGTGLAAGTAPAKLLNANQPWEALNVEAPDLVLDGGRYFLFYSGNNWDSASYAVGVAMCSGPLGPCFKTLSQPILSAGSSMAGPGGEAVFADSSGDMWMAFDAWLPGAVGYPHSRALYLRRLDLSGPNPVLEPAG
jgi:hypothetical protein